MYTISVTEAGIVLKGPGGSVTIGRTGVTVTGKPFLDLNGHQ